MGKSVATVPKGFQGVPPTVPGRGRLVAPPAAKIATVRRRLEARLVSAGAKVADDPGCGFGPMVERVGEDLAAGRLVSAERDLGLIEAGLAERRGYLAETAAGLAETRKLAEGRSEAVEARAQGGIEIARDGLRWLARKNRILAVHEQAGLKFRKDWERAGDGGLRGCLAEGGGGGRKGSGPTDAMLVARDGVKAALRGLGTPMLEPYVVLIAGHGHMLTDEAVFKGEAREHWLPVRIAFDMLARHYGLVR